MGFDPVAAFLAFGHRNRADLAAMLDGFLIPGADGRPTLRRESIDDLGDALEATLAKCAQDEGKSDALASTIACLEAAPHLHATASRQMLRLLLPYTRLGALCGEAAGSC
ncbi:hypothetical protein ACO2Q1_10225 [Brevundimonas sp. VNH65]|uniref:hypothetical protein n=1 Tax=Brevundimonas sp. VNH65 TaxID=3400917 RepID=UPI003BFB4E9C